MIRIPMTILLLGLLSGCAGGQVRHTPGEDTRVPPGKIEGNRFTGIRYPFALSAPPHWKVTTRFPDFMETLGYIRPLPTDKEQTEVYAFNPETGTNIQFDVTPAAPDVTFDRETIQLLATAGADSLVSELLDEHGTRIVDLAIGPTTPAALKGVPFAAKKHVTYTLRGVRREQGWIYGFAEPYQIFILYMILEKEGSNDREEIGRTIDTFGFGARSDEK